MRILSILLLTSLELVGQYVDQDVELPALRYNENSLNSYRVFKTTISDKSLFEKKYKNTNLTLGFVIRYHFYTSINLNSETNQLISMDGTKFNLTSKNAFDLTDEIISLVSKMYLGKKEFEEFKEINKKPSFLKKEGLNNLLKID